MCLSEELRRAGSANGNQAAQWADLHRGQFSPMPVRDSRLSPVRKWEEELRLEKDAQVSTTLLASELADKVGGLVVSGRT